jgi:hypothetical protein
MARQVLPPAAVFKQAVSQLHDLVWLQGLTAVPKREGGRRITARDSSMVLGSVNIDRDCLKKRPNANRWDYAIGYARNDAAVVFFVEVHSADSHNVAEVEKKLDWLMQLLNSAGGKPLLALNRDGKYHWVASGRFGIPKHVPQYRKLELLRSKRGLVGPVEHLELA